jgi:hypothetical protein
LAPPTRRVRGIDALDRKGRRFGWSSIREHKQNKSYFTSGFGRAAFDPLAQTNFGNISL